jgi:hypothetical protein
MMILFDCRLGTASFQPCGFFGGNLWASSGHSLSRTARDSSEIWSMPSTSSNSDHLDTVTISPRAGARLSSITRAPCALQVVSRGAGTPAESTSRSFGAARPANARGELIRSCTVRSWRRSVSAYNRGGMWHVLAPHRPCIGHRTGYSLHVMPGFSGLASADFDTATSGDAPGFFYDESSRGVRS